MKVVIEILVSGTAPSTVAKYLDSAIILAFTNTMMKEIPNIDCTRKMRVYMRVITNTLAFYWLEKKQEMETTKL